MSQTLRSRPPGTMKLTKLQDYLRCERQVHVALRSSPKSVGATPIDDVTVSVSDDGIMRIADGRSGRNSFRVFFAGRVEDIDGIPTVVGHSAIAPEVDWIQWLFAVPFVLATIAIVFARATGESESDHSPLWTWVVYAGLGVVPILVRVAAWIASSESHEYVVSALPALLRKQLFAAGTTS